MLTFWHILKKPAHDKQHVYDLALIWKITGVRQAPKVYVA